VAQAEFIPLQAGACAGVPPSPPTASTGNHAAPCLNSLRAPDQGASPESYRDACPPTTSFASLVRLAFNPTFPVGAPRWSLPGDPEWLCRTERSAAK